MGQTHFKETTTRSPLGDYLREIRDHDLLTAEQEVALAHAGRDGDAGALNRLVGSNLKLVVKVARDFEGRGLALEDLVGEGNLGLIRAAKEFDPSYGTRFSTYASHWIKQAIRHALITTTATIRLPAHMVGLLTKWRRAERAFLREFGQPATFDQLAVTLGLTDAKRQMVERALLACRLTPGGASDEGQGDVLEEAADDREAPDCPMEADDDRRLLLRRLGRLDDRERTILTLRFGLGGCAPMTLKQIGNRLGVTREWVRKIEVRAVRKLDDRWVPTPDPEDSRRPRARRSSRTAAPRSA